MATIITLFEHHLKKIQQFTLLYLSTFYYTQCQTDFPSLSQGSSKAVLLPELTFTSQFITGERQHTFGAFFGHDTR